MTDLDFRFSVLIKMFVTTISFSPGTFKSTTKRSHSRLKFTREQFWYKLLRYEFVNPTIKISLLRMCSVFYSSFVCISAYANVYFKTTLWECLRAGLPPGFPSTAPPPVRVSAVLSAPAVWIPNQQKKRKGLGGD